MIDMIFSYLLDGSRRHGCGFLCRRLDYMKVW